MLEYETADRPETQCIWRRGASIKHLDGASTAGKANGRRQAAHPSADDDYLPGRHLSPFAAVEWRL